MSHSLKNTHLLTFWWRCLICTVLCLLICDQCFFSLPCFFLRCFWSRGFVSCTTRSRVRGGSNAKLWYVHISLQSVYLPQRPDSDWHSYKQWVKDLMCTVQTSCHGLGTCTWLKNKHLTCINIWCVFLVKILCPYAVFLEDLLFILLFSQST